jgi:hypothetical protein
MTASAANVENDKLKHWARESFDLDQMGRLALCGGFFCLVKSPRKLLEDVDHLLVRNLAEISVISTDGAEKLVVFEADNVIGLAAQLVERACRCYRHGQNQFFGIACAGSAQGRPRRRTGRDAVVEMAHLWLSIAS